MFIIGLNLSHDPSAVLFSDRKLLFAIEEEKICKIKSFHGFPKLALEHCLEIINSCDSQITKIKVAIGCINLREFLPSHYFVKKYFDDNSRILLKQRLLDIAKLISNLDQVSHSESIKKHIEKLVVSKISEKLKYKVCIEFEYVDHHVSHALSAVVGAPFSEGVIFTLDGKGDGRSGSAYVFKDGETRLIAELGEFQSIGQMYSIATEALGFKSKRHEGKVTGLAARGRSEVPMEFLKAEFGHENTLKKNSLYYLKGTRWNRTKFLSYYWRRIKAEKRTAKVDLTSVAKNFLKFCLLTKSAQTFELGRMYYRNRLIDFIIKNEIPREDLACAIQKYCEDLAVDFVSNALKETNQTESINICLAGGVFSNVLLNQKIFQLSRVGDVYVQPAMNDAGTALGAAYKSSEFMNLEFTLGAANPFFGPAASRPSTYLHNSAFEVVCEDIGAEEISFISDAIFDNQILGVFRGKLEWGPRALGNRSIIARPDKREITKLLNERLGRSDFMPFAPMVLEEDINLVFRGEIDKLKVAGNLMTMTFSLHDQAAMTLEAISHIDGTARPQVIREASNDFYSQLLRSVKEKIGYGVCINTSFNMHEFPIIHDANDAFEMLSSGAIDLLVYENMLFRRRVTAPV